MFAIMSDLVKTKNGYIIEKVTIEMGGRSGWMPQLTQPIADRIEGGFTNEVKEIT